MKDNALKVVLTTFEKPEEAKLFAHWVIQEKICVCAQIDAPMTSIYPWGGKVEEAQEVRLWMKVFEQNLMSVQAALKEEHSYEIPQFIVLDVDQVSADYLAWAKESLS